ncbi:hypothetical protein PoB_000134900 [Plakobranchus ocellatus]|uniref:Uncharacterized protein n=1 Tax=Plakobranchus ocellatus TaxID=259542 RepID=A0AAV3XYJ6_9GAST|nr:hypothetical protein PoB_000134900 [Plakobranchus ocellatus]
MHSDFHRYQRNHRHRHRYNDYINPTNHSLTTGRNYWTSPAILTNSTNGALSQQQSTFLEYPFQQPSTTAAMPLPDYHASSATGLSTAGLHTQLPTRYFSRYIERTES